MNLPSIPAGILCKGTEVFYSHKHDELFALHNGQRKRFFDLPEEILDRFREMMEADQPALEKFHKYGIRQTEDQLFLYVKCRFGAFNNNPDLCPEGNLSPEMWDCGCSGNCCLQSLYRTQLPVAHGILTDREVQVLKLICNGYLGKQTAAMLAISEFTVDKHKRSIFQKTGFRSVVELTAWAAKSQII